MALNLSAFGKKQESSSSLNLSAFGGENKTTFNLGNILDTQKTAMSTPAIANPNEKSVLKTTIDILKWPFSAPNEPTQVRRAFEKDPIDAKVGNYNLPPIITGSAKVGFSLLELLPKVATLAAANFNPAGEVQTPFGIDKRRIGFEGEGTTVLGSGKKSEEDFSRRMAESPKTPYLNATMSFGVLPAFDILDALVAGDIVTQGAKILLSKTGFDPVLKSSLIKVGLTPETATYDTLKEQFMDRAKVLISKGDLNGLNELGQATDHIARTMTGVGIPRLNKFGEIVEKYADLFTRNLGESVDLVRPLGYEATKGLPGYREKPGQAPAFGMSTKEVEPVGFGDDLANEAKQYENLPKGTPILNPKEILLVGPVNAEVVKNLNLNGQALISRQTLKHIVEQRGDLALEKIQDIPTVLNNPTKVADNSAKRKDSYLFARMNGKARGVVLEVTKTPDGDRVVSAFPIDRKTYGKLVDISGRPDVPPLDISPVESGISTAQKTFDSNITNNTEVGKPTLTERLDNLNLRKQTLKQDFDGEMEIGYQKFVKIMRNPRLTFKLKETIEAGDVETFKRIVQEKEIISKEVGDLFLGNYDQYINASQAKTDNEIYEIFRDRLAKENPAILYPKEVRQKLGLRSEASKLRQEEIELKEEMRLNAMLDRSEKEQARLIELQKKNPDLARFEYTLSSDEKVTGARIGYRKGVSRGKEIGAAKMAEQKDAIINSLREKNVNIENAKKQIVQYANDNLPLNERGKLMTVVRDAKTGKDVARAFTRIDRRVQEVAIKNALTELKNTVERMSDSNAISADYRAKIKDIIENYELSGHTQATIDKLKATQDYINRQSSIGENVELPQRVIDKLKILDRTPKDKLNLEQIQALQSEVELLAKLGETKWSSKQALYEGEKELRKNELLNSATSINSKMVQNLGLEKNKNKWITGFIKARNWWQRTRIGLTPIEGLADITGMQPMKQVMDLNFGNYLTYNDGVIKQWYELTKDFDETNFRRIGAYAVNQQAGGTERLIANGMTQETIDGLKLTESEMKAYNFARETFDSEFPAVRKYALDNYNKDVGGVKNYVSFMSDNDAMNELELYDRFGTPPEFPTNTKTVEKGFTEQRAKQADYTLELNIDKIFRRHIDDVAYMLTMGKDVKQYFEIVNSPEIRAKLGDVGSLAWLQYLDLMARKGGSEGAKRIAILDMFRKNLAVGVLSFRISSALVQFTSFADTMGTIGAEWAMKGASSIATSKEWRNFVMDNFPEVKKAIGDDIAFREFGEGFLARIGGAGLKPLQALDGLMRSTAVSGAYAKLAAEKGIVVDLANPDKALVQEATRMMRQSQGSSFFKDQPLSITSNYGLFDNKSVNKMVTTFQSFMLARWDNLQRQIWRLGIKDKNYKKAGMSFFWMVIVAAALEEGIRRGTKAVISKGTEMVTGKEDSLDQGSFAWNSTQNVIQSVPLVGQLFSSMEYGSNPIPVINTYEQMQSGLSSVWGGKALQTKLRGAITAAGGAGSLAGIPGSSQGAQLIKGMVPSVNAKKQSPFPGLPKLPKLPSLPALPQLPKF